MKIEILKNAFLVPFVALLLGGCATAAQTNAQIDEGIHAPKRAMDMAHGVETDSNINQINQSISIFKSTNDDKAPATIEEAKAAAKVPAEMWIDTDTKLPLEYDAASGTVHRVGAAPNSVPHAGAKGAPGRINIPGAGGY
ncbi:hypothetical protein B1R32_102245 [Abditibacterium utsteinense]|uniref:Uncharacterized protein n=1 Tax=Abditibacterium utsteinense TaxID=1960156 RepID=A0A2S8SWQ0_9BACT|nr:hypothetical protein [Abditibacterium utsteinense]PQV65236.1 hypothetical protein B1R32_102245 [Abditibacterium utsteinense]